MGNRNMSNQFRYELHMNGKLVGNFEYLENFKLEDSESKVKQNIIFKDGYTNSQELHNWYEEIKIGKILKKRLIISILYRNKEALANIVLISAFPVEYFDKVMCASPENISIGKLELRYRQMKSVIIQKDIDF